MSLWCRHRVVSFADHPSCSDTHPESLRSRATEVRDEVLGPRRLRTRRAPTGRGEDRVGGTRFERDFPPNENVRDGRCYPYGMSYESIPKLYAPCAQGRLSRTSEDVLAYRSDLLEASTFVNV